MSPSSSEQLVHAIVSRDWDALHRCLAPDVWLRALLPRSVVESHTDVEAISVITGWFAAASAFEVVRAEHADAGDSRARVGWQVELLPEWAPETWHRVEQVGFCRISDGRVRRLDLSCTGFLAMT